MYVNISIISPYARHIYSSLVLLARLIARWETSALHVHSSERNPGVSYAGNSNWKREKKNIKFPSIPYIISRSYIRRWRRWLFFSINYPRLTSNREKMSNGWVSPTPSRPSFSDVEPRFEERNGGIPISEFSTCDAKCTKMTELVTNQMVSRTEGKLIFTRYVKRLGRIILENSVFFFF